MVRGYAAINGEIMFESLKIFVAAAESGSINSAAEACFITPPAAMKRINALEDELGVRLFERSSRGVRLTRAGESYYSDALGIIAAGEEATARARRAAAGSLVVRAGTSILNPCRPLVDLWNECSAQYPQYRIEIVPFTDSVAELAEIYSHMGRRFDVMYGIYDSTAALKPFNMLELGRTLFCIAVPRGHRLCERQVISYSDLRGERIIIVRLGRSPLVDAVRLHLAEYPDISLEESPEYYDIGVFNRCVAEGVLLLSVGYWRDVHPSIVTIPLEGEAFQTYGIIYPKQPAPSVERFVQCIAEVCKNKSLT